METGKKSKKAKYQNPTKGCINASVIIKGEKWASRERQIEGVEKEEMRRR